MINDSTLDSDIFAPSQQIVFIDSQVENSLALVEKVVLGIQTVVLDHDRDGIEQITEILKFRSNFTVVHIIACASPGCLYLGNSELSLNTLGKYATKLKSWFNTYALIRKNNLTIYGCNVAAGDAGEEFIAKLCVLMEASVRVSKTKVGYTALDSNWELDKVADFNADGIKQCQPGCLPFITSETWNGRGL